MDVMYLLSGILAGMYATLAFIFLTSRDKQKPYREAFGWLMLAGTVDVTLDIIFTLTGSNDLTETILKEKDLLMLPFLVMEGGALINQDMKTLPWVRRWIRLLLHELPLVAMLILQYIVNEPWVLVTMAVYGLIYVSYYHVMFALRLHRYRRELSRLGKERERYALTWIYTVIALNTMLWMLYCVLFAVDSEYMYAIYTALAMVVWLFHAECLNRQVRIDMRMMMETATVAPVQIVDVGTTGVIRTQEEQRKVLKQKKTTNDTLELFLMDFPHFRKNLQDCAVSKITQKDLILAMFICQGRKNEELADILCIGVKSVEVARSRLRSKLNLSKNDTLKNFLIKKLQ